MLSCLLCLLPITVSVQSAMHINGYFGARVFLPLFLELEETLIGFLYNCFWNWRKLRLSFSTELSCVQIDINANVVASLKFYQEI